MPLAPTASRSRARDDDDSAQPRKPEGESLTSDIYEMGCSENYELSSTGSAGRQMSTIRSFPPAYNSFRPHPASRSSRAQWCLRPQIYSAACFQRCRKWLEPGILAHPIRTRPEQRFRCSRPCSNSSSAHNTQRLLICKAVAPAPDFYLIIRDVLRLESVRQNLHRRRVSGMKSTLGLPPSRGLRAFDGNHTHMTSRRVS